MYERSTRHYRYRHRSRWQARNDGTPGSGLYSVPIKLNRVPSAREAQLLVRHWDRPSQFITMHRPGVAQVSGSSLILTRTTIDEAKQYQRRLFGLLSMQPIETKRNCRQLMKPKQQITQPPPHDIVSMLTMSLRILSSKSVHPT